MKILITLCGREGSKGIKNKNFKQFLGHPLVFYTIAAAKYFKKQNLEKQIDICINTDSEELLKICSLKKIDLVKRPSALATDISAKIPAIKYATEEMEKRKGYIYDYIIDLDITSPLRKVNDIKNTLDVLLENNEIDLVFSAVPARRNPYFNMIEKTEKELKKVINSNFIRRQDSPIIYDMNASIYCYRRNSLLNKIKKSPFDGAFDISLMEDTGVLDIDHEQDFILMEILAEYFYQNFEYKDILREI